MEKKMYGIKVWSSAKENDWYLLRDMNDARESFVQRLRADNLDERMNSAMNVPTGLEEGNLIRVRQEAVFTINTLLANESRALRELIAEATMLNTRIDPQLPTGQLNNQTSIQTASNIVEFRERFYQSSQILNRSINQIRALFSLPPNTTYA